MNVNFQIRKATIRDARKISYLIRKNADYVHDNNYTPEQLVVWKNDNTLKAIKSKLKQREIFCAFKNGKLIGTIGLEGNYLVGLYISYRKRGQGIGYKLLVFLEDYAFINIFVVLHLKLTTILLDS